MLTVGCTLFLFFPLCAHSKTVCSGANLVTGEYRKMTKGTKKKYQSIPTFFLFFPTLNLLAIATLLSN